MIRADARRATDAAARAISRRRIPSEPAHSKAGKLSNGQCRAGNKRQPVFITVAATPHLDNRHSIFGEVVEGQDIADKDFPRPRATEGSAARSRYDEVRIERVRSIEAACSRPRAWRNC